MASLYKRNGVWYVAVYVDGRRVYRSTKTTRKPDALRFLSQFHNTPPKPSTGTRNQNLPPGGQCLKEDKS